MSVPNIFLGIDGFLGWVIAIVFPLLLGILLFIFFKERKKYAN